MDVLDVFGKDKRDDRLDNYPFMGGSPLQIFTVVVVYLFLTRKLGPKIMAHRKPFELQRIMPVYNAFQVVINLWLAFYALIYVLTEDDYNVRCALTDFSRTPRGYKEAHLVYYYLVFKVIDLMDTVFITLRKNYRQASFLHLYHHAAMCVGTYFTVQYAPGGPYIIVTIVNSFVHVIMYFYYFLTSYRPELKQSLWWKKHITQVQMVQFCYLMLNFASHIYRSDCTYPLFWSIYGFIQTFSFFVLFTNFYIKTYVLKKSK